VEARAVTILLDPMMTPIQRSVCAGGYGLILRMRKGRKMLMKLKEKATPN
jgi:hypothetical protein